MCYSLCTEEYTARVACSGRAILFHLNTVRFEYTISGTRTFWNFPIFRHVRVYSPPPARGSVCSLGRSRGAHRCSHSCHYISIKPELRAFTSYCPQSFSTSTRERRPLHRDSKALTSSRLNSNRYVL